MQNNPEAIQAAMRMAQSEAGQQLMRMLQQNAGQELNQAMNRAVSGDYESARAILVKLMQDPQARELMNRIGGSHGPDGR